MENTLFIIICVLAFLLRAIPRFILTNALVSDTYYHLKCAADIRANSFRIPKRIEQSVLPHEYTYPFGYHFLLALFPEKQRLWVERLTGAISDTCNIAIVYFFTSWLVEQAGRAELANLPILVTALFAFSPTLLRTGSGPRAYNGCPRVLGQVLYQLHLVTAYHAYMTQNPYSLAASLLAGAALICTAKFGNQVLFLFGIVFSIVITPLYSLLVLGCFLTAFIFTMGQAWKVVRGQIVYSYLYARYLQHTYLIPNLRTIKAYCLSIRGALGDFYRTRSLAQLITWYFREQYFLHFLLTVFPQNLLFFFLIPNVMRMSPNDQFMMAWIGAGLVWFLTTKYKYMVFLGEGERYVEYSLLPSYYLFVSYFLQSNSMVIYLYLAYSVLSAIYFSRDYIKRHQGIHDEYTASEPLFELIRSLPAGVILPVGWIHHQMLYRTSFPIVSLASNADPKLLPLEEYLFIFDTWPYPPKDFNKMVDRYDVTYIAADKGCLAHYLNNVTDNPQMYMDAVLLIHETQDFMLFVTRKSISNRHLKLQDAIQIEDWHLAMALLKELIVFEPASAGLHLTLGDLHMKLDEVENAVDAYRTTLSTSQVAEAFVGMANALIMLDRSAEAKEFILHALTLHPFHAGVRECRFRIDQLTKGKMTSDATVPGNAVGQEASYISQKIGSLIELANTYLGEGLYDRAKTVISQVLASDPDNKDALRFVHLLSIIALKDNKLSAAVAAPFVDHATPPLSQSADTQPVASHKNDFETIYQHLDRGDALLQFPLLDIERYEWKRGAWANGYFNYIYRRTSSHILDSLVLQDNQRILVIGCGMGFDERNIKSLHGSADLWSIDISSEMLLRAAENQTPSKLCLSLAEKLPFPDNFFDRVLSREVIEHVMDPQQMFVEIERVLRPNGIAVITTPNPKALSPNHFYENVLLPKIARHTGFTLPPPQFKDAAPCLSDIKVFAANARLTLHDYFFDCALYCYLSLLPSRYPDSVGFFKKHLVKAAHYFSALENNRVLSRFFCDQAKYVLVKDSGNNQTPDLSHDSAFVCPACQGSLEQNAARYLCRKCGTSFPIESGFPNFIVSFNAGQSAETAATVANSPQNAERFHNADARLRLNYGRVYFVLALLASLLVRHNPHSRPSRILGKKSAYQKYIVIN